MYDSDFEDGFLIGMIAFGIILSIIIFFAVQPREATIQKLGDKACIEQFGSESELQQIQFDGKIKCTKKKNTAAPIYG